MNEYEVFDVITLIAIGAFLLSCPTLLISWGSSSRLAIWRTRRWIRKTVHDGRPADELFVSPVLAGRDRARGWGALAALSLAVALAPPKPGGDSSLTDNFGLWLTSMMAGFWIGGVARVVFEYKTAHTPDGVRVAASAPHRLNWYVSRAAVLLLALAIAVQAGRGVLEIHQVWPWEGLADDVLVTVVGLVAMIIMTAAILIMTPWLVSQPVFAGDDREFDLQIRLRREHIRASVMVMYPLVYSVGFMINRINTDNVPVEVRRSWPEWLYWLSLAAILLALGGLLLQQRLETKWNPSSLRSTPETDAKTGQERLPDVFEPAPGTNGWIFSRKQRPTA